MPRSFSRMAMAVGAWRALSAMRRTSVVSASKFQRLESPPGVATSRCCMSTPDIGLDHARVDNHLARDSRLDHFAVTEHQHAVADAGDDVHVVLDDEHRHAALVARIEDEARHVRLLFL